jgi:Amt family ammonium transporter
MRPHKLTMTVTGASMLWVGWFGFNVGSALGANGDAGMAMLVTHLGASGGVIAWSAMEVDSDTANRPCSAQLPAWWQAWAR